MWSSLKSNEGKKRRLWCERKGQSQKANEKQEHRIKGNLSRDEGAKMRELVVKECKERRIRQQGRIRAREENQIWIGSNIRDQRETKAKDHWAGMKGLLMWGSPKNTEGKINSKAIRKRFKGENLKTMETKNKTKGKLESKGPLNQDERVYACEADLRLMKLKK